MSTHIEAARQALATIHLNDDSLTHEQVVARLLVGVWHVAMEQSIDVGSLIKRVRDRFIQEQQAVSQYTVRVELVDGTTWMGEVEAQTPEEASTLASLKFPGGTVRTTKVV